jgi:hypothetical protein
MKEFKIGNPKKNETSSLIVAGKKTKCPKCGWKSADYGNGSGFISTVEGAKGDWCLRCYVKKVTKDLPRMKHINK